MVMNNPMIQQEITALIEENEKLAIMRDSCTALLREAYRAIKSDKRFSFDWNEWNERVEKLLRLKP